MPRNKTRDSWCSDIVVGNINGPIDNEADENNHSNQKNIFNKKTRKLGKHADLDSMSELSSLSTWSKQINRHKEVMHKSQTMRQTPNFQKSYLCKSKRKPTKKAEREKKVLQKRKSPARKAKTKALAAIDPVSIQEQNELFDEAFPAKQRKIISPTEGGRRHDPFEYHSEEEFKLPDINFSKRARQNLRQGSKEVGACPPALNTVPQISPTKTKRPTKSRRENSVISEKSKASEKTILDRSNTGENGQTLEKLDLISMAPKRKPSNRKRLRARPKNSSSTSLARLAKSTSESYERTDTPELVQENIAPKTLYTDRQQKPVPVEVVSPVPAQVEAQKAVESDSDLTPDELEEPPRAAIEIPTEDHQESKTSTFTKETKAFQKSKKKIENESTKKAKSKSKVKSVLESALNQTINDIKQVSKNSLLEDRKLTTPDTFTNDLILSEIQNLRSLQIEVSQAVQSRKDFRKQIFNNVLDSINKKMKAS